MKELLKLFVTGIILGVANVIPGVSGGTMAIVFNVYERLLSVITINIKKILSQWKFVLPLGAGVVTGILLFSKVITFLFTSYPVPTNMFFCGLIAGSIPLVFRKIPGKGLRKWSPSIMLSLLVSFGVMALMFLFSPDDASIVYTELTFTLFIRLTVSAALAAVAMIIPGISGSFLMIVLGVYTTIIASISDMNIPLLIPVAAGVIIGLFSGAGLVKFLLSRIPGQTYGAIFGLVLGSIMVILPFEGFIGSYTDGSFLPVLILSLASCILGFVLAYFSSKNEK